MIVREPPAARHLAAACLAAAVLFPLGTPVHADEAPIALRQSGVAGQAAADRTASDRAFPLQLSARRRSEVQERTALGRRLVGARRFLDGARILATAYALDPQVPLLLEIARACRQADLDAEALAMYRGLPLEQLEPAQRAEAEEQLQLLRAKIDEPDVGITLAVRMHLDEAKRAFFANQFVLAANEYALAYVIKRLPRVLFNEAQVYRRAGKVELACILYQRLIEEDPATPLRKEVEAYLAELRPLALRAPLHKRAWFWTVIVGSAALIGAGIGIGIGLNRKDGFPSTDGGVVDVTFGLRLAH